MDESPTLQNGLQRIPSQISRRHSLRARTVNPKKRSKLLDKEQVDFTTGISSWRTVTCHLQSGIATPESGHSRPNIQVHAIVSPALSWMWSTFQTLRAWSTAVPRVNHASATTDHFRTNFDVMQQTTVWPDVYHSHWFGHLLFNLSRPSPRDMERSTHQQTREVHLRPQLQFAQSTEGTYEW